MRGEGSKIFTPLVHRPAPKNSPGGIFPQTKVEGRSCASEEKRRETR